MISGSLLMFKNLVLILRPVSSFGKNYLVFYLGYLNVSLFLLNGQKYVSSNGKVHNTLKSKSQKDMDFYF